MPHDIKDNFGKQIELFRSDPFHSALNTHKLSGQLRDYYAFYLRDGFRVLFDFISADEVLLVNIGSHDDYRKWARGA